MTVQTVMILVQAVQKGVGKVMGQTNRQVQNLKRNMEGFNGVMTQNMDNFKKLNKQQGAFSSRGQAIGNRLRMMTAGLRGFRMEMLGVMFFGMAIQRMFSSLLRPAAQAMGIFDIWGAMLQVVFLPVMNLLMPVFIWLMNMFMNLSGPSKLIIGILVVLAAVFGTILFVIGVLALGIGAVITAFSAGWVIMGIIIAAIIAVVVFLVIMFIENWKTIKDVTVKVFTAIKDFFVMIFDWIVDIMVKAITWCVDWSIKIWNGVKAFFKKLWDGIKKVFVTIWQTISNKIKEKIKTIISWIKDKWDGVTDFFKTMGTKIKDIFTGIWDSAKDIFGKVISKIKDAIDKLKFWKKKDKETKGSPSGGGSMGHEDDFIWRPGGGPVSINPNDTLVGFKGAGAGVGGGTNIVQNITVSGSLKEEVERQIKDNNSRLVDDIRRLTGIKG